MELLHAIADAIRSFLRTIPGRRVFPKRSKARHVENDAHQQLNTQEQHIRQQIAERGSNQITRKQDRTDSSRNHNTPHVADTGTDPHSHTIDDFSQNGQDSDNPVNQAGEFPNVDPTNAAAQTSGEAKEAPPDEELSANISGEAIDDQPSERDPIGHLGGSDDGPIDALLNHTKSKPIDRPDSRPTHDEIAAPPLQVTMPTNLTTGDNTGADDLLESDPHNGDLANQIAAIANDRHAESAVSKQSIPVTDSGNEIRPETREPGIYQPPSGKPPTPTPQRDPSSEGNRNKTSSPNHAQTAPILLRLLFDRGGCCRITLLPKRPAGMPDKITLRSSKERIECVALDDDWYQDIEPARLGYLLRNGLVWKDEATGHEWNLSGRDLFVFGQGTSHRGFVSCPRLALQRKHIVVCAEAKLVPVEEVLHEAGCDRWQQLGQTDGLPDGWVALRPVVPSRPVAQVDEADILNVLRPLPQIEIAFEGGIGLGYNSWLAGHPPSIRVYGDPQHTQSIRIDGQQAEPSADGSYTAPGWDESGNHEVWCVASTTRYQLIEHQPSQVLWPAYSFQSPRNDTGAYATICGPIVRSYSGEAPLGYGTDDPETIPVPPTNPVLIGPALQDFFRASHPHPLHGVNFVASPPFAPVWALPAEPLLCDKRHTRILLIGDPVEPERSIFRIRRSRAPATLHPWCRLVMDASRKGLFVQSATPEIQDLWSRYRAHARYVWRNSR